MAVHNDLKIKPLGSTPLPPGLIVRGMEPADLNFILETWKSANRKTMKYLPDSVYHVGMEKMIGALGLTQRLLVLVDPAALPGHDIIGWMAYREMAEGDAAIVVHFMYVKQEFRNQKAHERLLRPAGWVPEMVILASHVWHAPRPIRRKYKVFYNPFFCMAGYV